MSGINEIDMWAYYKRHAAREAPPTDDDLAGLPAEREITEVYNNRRAASSVDYSVTEYWEDLAAEAARNAVQEAEWGRQDAHANDKYPRS